jgi:methyl-accepting chemotaxis protein
MFKDMKVGTRLAAGFLLVSIMGAIVAAIGIFNMGKINDQAESVYQRELLGISHVKEANINLVYVARGVRNMLLASSDADRKKFADSVEKARTTMKEELDKARPLFWRDTGKAAFADFDRKLDAYDKALPEVLKKVNAEPLQENREATQYVQLTFAPLANAMDDALTALSQMKEKNAADAARETTHLYQTSRSFMITLVTMSVLAGLALGVLITRSLTRQLGGEPNHAASIAGKIASGDLTTAIDVRPDDNSSLLFAMKSMRDSLVNIVGQVRNGTDTIASASGQIAAGNLDLSSRTEEQASSLEETASSMEELTSTVKQNADNARQANGLAVTASEVALRGGAVVSEVVETMGSINDSAKKIVDIIGVIDGIAFQTNILALNAAVEAARAGEQGRGFAVVASEVRNLAQRSAAAAKEIKALIGDSVEKVDVGSKLVDQAGTTMQEVVDSIRRVTDIMAEISAASQEQTSGIEQINQAVAQMDQVTQQNASLVEEAAAASESMQEQARNLAQVVSVFRLDAGHTALAVAPRPAPAAPRKAVVSRPAKSGRASPAPAIETRSRAAVAATADADWQEF